MGEHWKAAAEDAGAAAKADAAARVAAIKAQVSAEKWVLVLKYLSSDTKMSNLIWSCSFFQAEKTVAEKAAAKAAISAQVRSKQAVEYLRSILKYLI